MRSIARWVFPVLVGPKTAVTPAPRAPDSRLLTQEKEMDIKGGALGRSCFCTTTKRPSGRRPLVLNLWNASRTNRARIAHSKCVGLRSRLHLEGEGGGHPTPCRITLGAQGQCRRIWLIPEAATSPRSSNQRASLCLCSCPSRLPS